MEKRKIKKNKGLKEWGKALLLALILALLIKGFIIESFMVDSPKMEKTILTGDFIMVNKVAYGARLPISLLSVPFFSSVYSDLVKLPYFRIPGLSRVKLNDIIVFNYPVQYDPPIDKRLPLAKRCVGLPGDTIEIDNKKVFVNNKPFEKTAEVQFNYRLVTNGILLEQDFLDQYNISEGGMVSEIGIYDFPLTKSKLDEIKNDESVRYVRELKDFPGENTNYIFPIGHHHSFNKDYFGPVIVPFKGQVVKLDTYSIEKYREIIADHEGNDLEIRNYKIFINGTEKQSYTIQNDYYFVLDDNRDNAKDSRYWGFLPENHIIGKASVVWFSYNKTDRNVRWNRIFKTL